jgi:sugar phosphate isomerase/epimerase
VPRLKIGIELAGLRLPARQALVVAARLGAGAVELDARGDFAPGNFSQTGLRQLRKTLEDLRLRVCAVSFRTRRGFGAPADLEPRIEAAKAAIELAARLAARSVITRIGHTAGRNQPADNGLLVEVLTDLAHFGNRAGAFLAVETGEQPVAELAQLFEQLPEGIIGVDLNPGNLAANGHSSLEAIESLGPRILHVHATDGVCDPGKRRGERVELGSGVADFPALLGALEEVGYQGYYTIQPTAGGDARAEAARAIEFLRKF